ncbi:MAG TPA: alanine--tRNA ligase-related protein, partial [Ignavibacteriaceae bacterium]|nr:alanine--tRNA ligase-related protein [Ignavibacteriaceae bacterium]
CGPCSEVHINLSDDFENPEWVNAGKPECIELWNLVFIQYNRDEKGTLHELPLKHVDTGMGFERMCAVLQKKSSNYDTDVFTPLIDAVSKMSGVKYKSEENKIPMRVIADHIRTLTFAIADGAVPGNDGRGYVLRRILRRAARYGRKLDLKKPFLFELVDIVVKEMGDVFPEIKEKKNYVKKVIKAEEESFYATLDHGIELFNVTIVKVIVDLLEKGKYHGGYNIIGVKDISKNDYIISIKKTDMINSVEEIRLSQWDEKQTKLHFKIRPIIKGEDVFKLYDTYGFPVDLTNVMAKEKGFSIDEEGFNKLMEEQKQKGKEASKNKFASVNISINDLSGFELIDKANSVFTGYDELKSSSKIIGHKKENGNDLLLLDKTPFYVEAGGQIDDHGEIETGKSKLKVVDVTKVDNKTIHVVENQQNSPVIPGTEVIAHVDEARRWDIMRNHSATHFLHAALRKILGTHVQQAGSYVGPDRLRFDFTHFSKLTDTELREIESLVNEELRRNIPLQHHRNIPFDEAKKMGALMFFGDKYGDKVNVVQFGDFSMEFCGGTHVKNSSEIGLFKIISESSIASGVRRIEAVTGSGVENYIQRQLDLIKQQEEKFAQLIEEKKKIEKEISELKLQDKLGQIDSVLRNASDINGVNVYKAKVEADNMDELKSFGDEMRNKIKNGVGVLFADVEGKVGIVCVVSDELIKEKNLSAGKIVGELAKLVGGGGGGRPHLATAGGKEVSKIPSALKEVEKIVGKFI